MTTPPCDCIPAEEVTALLRKRLKASTLAHVLSATAYAAELAERAGIDPDLATAAGLLHDLRKATSPEKLLAKARQLGIDISSVQNERPKLLHGPVAAEESRRRWDIPAEVHEAVFWHTTGCPGLGPVGLALYVADFAEPLRLHPEAPVAREIAQGEGLLAAARYVADAKLAYATAKPPLDPFTGAFRAWLHGEENA
jgi:putative nucleotidyltransferase with HDIG domain